MHLGIAAGCSANDHGERQSGGSRTHQHRQRSGWPVKSCGAQALGHPLRPACTYPMGGERGGWEGREGVTTAGCRRETPSHEVVVAVRSCCHNVEPKLTAPSQHGGSDMDVTGAGARGHTRRSTRRRHGRPRRALTGPSSHLVRARLLHGRRRRQMRGGQARGPARQRAAGRRWLDEERERQMCKHRPPLTRARPATTSAAPSHYMPRPSAGDGLSCLEEPAARSGATRAHAIPWRAAPPPRCVWSTPGAECDPPQA